MEVSHLSQIEPRLNSPPHGGVQLTAKTSRTLNSPSAKVSQYWFLTQDKKLFQKRTTNVSVNAHAPITNL